MPATDQIDAITPAEAKRNAGSKWILVVSGQPVIRDLLERFFQLDGHFVSTAAEGAEGLIKARTLPIDLIVLDHDLFTSNIVRTQLKAEVATSHLPVLWVGNRHSRQEFQSPVMASTDSHLMLPFSYAQMNEAVKHLLGLAS